MGLEGREDRGRGSSEGIVGLDPSAAGVEKGRKYRVVQLDLD